MSFVPLIVSMARTAPMNSLLCPGGELLELVVLKQPGLMHIHESKTHFRFSVYIQYLCMDMYSNV